MRKPLLIIDGDSFAHRAYHALPKTIRRDANKPAGAILGFANFLLRFYESENPRAVLVGWDTLDEPTYRHEALEAYQAGRVFADVASLLERYGTLNKMIAAGRFAAQADKLLLYKSIATMDRTAPLPPLRKQKPTWDKAAKLARSWKLNKLAERLGALAQA